MRHWEDKGKRRVWRWVLLVYSLAAFALSVIGAFTFRSDIILAAIFLTAASVLVYEVQLEKGVMWFVIILLLLPTLPYGFIYSCSSFEIASARDRGEGRLLGVPFISVSDSSLTPYFRRYVSEEFPEPEWMPSFKGQIGLLGFFTPHVDYLIKPASGIELLIESYSPPEEVKDAIIKGYFELSTVPHPKGDITSFYLVKKYYIALLFLYQGKDGDVQLSDLPDPKKVAEDGLKELKDWPEQQ